MSACWRATLASGWFSTLTRSQDNRGRPSRSPPPSRLPAPFSPRAEPQSAVDAGQLDRELPQPACVVGVQGVVGDPATDARRERLGLLAVLEVRARDALDEG